MMQKISASQSSRPATPPMDLDTGRLDPHEATALGLLLIGALAVSAVGSLISWAVLPTHYDLSAWRFVLLAFGFLLAAAGLAFGGMVAFLTVDRWLSYRRWLQEWQDKALATWDVNGGQEVTSTFELTQLVPTQPQHVAIAALSIHQEILSGDGSLSISSVAGSRFLGAGNLIGVGELSPNAARKMLTTFSQLGLIRGRSERQPGEWVPTSTDEVLQLVSQNWRKVR